MFVDLRVAILVGPDTWGPLLPESKPLSHIQLYRTLLARL
jgi:hypothetical protein